MNLKHLQKLKLENAKRICKYENKLCISKQLAKSWWEGCDPNTKVGRKAFSKLNYHRDNIRFYEKELKQLREIQKELKNKICLEIKFNTLLEEIFYN